MTIQTNMNLKLNNRNNCNLTAIAFDNKYLNNIFKNNNNINNSNGKALKDYNNNNNNNNVRRLRPSDRNIKKANDIEMKHNDEHKCNDNSNENGNDSIPPCIFVGCNTEMDPINKMDSKSHLILIHSNENKYSKPKRSNGYNNNTITYNGKNSNKNIYNSNIILKNNNKITRACRIILTDSTMGLDKNHACDVGGGWIHGMERNPLTRLVERARLTVQ